MLPAGEYFFASVSGVLNRESPALASCPALALDGEKLALAQDGQKTILAFSLLYPR